MAREFPLLSKAGESLFDEALRQGEGKQQQKQRSPRAGVRPLSASIGSSSSSGLGGSSATPSPKAGAPHRVASGLFRRMSSKVYNGKDDELSSAAEGAANEIARDYSGFSGGMSLRAPSRGLSGMGARAHKRSLSSNVGWGGAAGQQQQQGGRAAGVSFASATDDDTEVGDEEESFEALVQNWQHIQGTAFIYVSPPSVNAKAFGVASVWTKTNSDGSKKDAFTDEMEDAENAVFARREQQMLALKQHIILCSLQDALYTRPEHGSLAAMEPEALEAAIKAVGEDPVDIVRRILTKLKQRVQDATAAVVDNWYMQLRDVLDAFSLLSNAEGVDADNDDAGGAGGGGVGGGGVRSGGGGAGARSGGGSGGITFDETAGTQPPAAHKVMSDDEYERQLLGYHHSTKSGRLRGYSSLQEDAEVTHHRVNTATEMLTAALQGGQTDQLDIPSLIGASAESRRLLRHRSLVKLACEIEPALSSMNFEVLAEAAYRQAQESFKKRQTGTQGSPSRPRAATLSFKGSQSLHFSGGVCLREKWVFVSWSLRYNALSWDAMRMRCDAV